MIPLLNTAMVRLRLLPRDLEERIMTKRRGKSPPGVARKHLAAYEVHHRVDAKGVTDEHDDGNHEGREAKGWADGDELTPPV